MASTTHATAQNHKPDRSHNDSGEGTAREHLSDIQRARILSATIEIVAERGVANTNIAQIVDRSAVSRRTFYDIFTNREDCYQAAFDEAVVRAIHFVRDAYDLDVPWVERIRGSLIALLRFLEEEPPMARLLVVESLAAGPLVAKRRSQVVSQIVSLVDQGQAREGEPYPLAGEGVVGAALSIVHSRLSERGSDGLVDLVGPLMSMIVLPYQGKAAARRELERPRIKRKSASKRPYGAADPLRGLGMRLTYRTVRTLGAIAASPGASNRVIGEQAGMSDQGQISKLLRRLQGYGLIETNRRAEQGEPNAWILTPDGETLLHTIA